jgi:[ribosomal protein S5]-alanine N-acetyltransferase
VWGRLREANDGPDDSILTRVQTLAMAMPKHLPAIVSSAIVLRPFREEDWPVIQEASQDPHIPLITSVPSTRDPAEALAFIDRQRGRVDSGMGYPFAIADRESDEACGAIGLWPRDLVHGRASIGYWVVSSRRKQGLATEALRSISAWGLGLDQVHRLELYVEPWNEGSWRAAENAGYQREGLLRGWQQVGGQWRDMFMYSLVDAEEA